MQKWIPVATQLPTPGERILLCIGEVFVGEGWMRENKKDWIRYDELPTVEEIFHRPVTHWMPLPKAARNGGDTIEGEGIPEAAKETGQAD